MKGGAIWHVQTPPSLDGFLGWSACEDGFGALEDGQVQGQGISEPPELGDAIALVPINEWFTQIGGVPLLEHIHQSRWV